MRVGIGLPSTIRGVEGEQLLEWARRAEARGFSSLGTIDRIVYDNYDPLIALAGAAAVTDRIRLATTILIGPYRANAALVAKQAASLDRLSDGRLILGIAVGGREDDYEASGVDFHTRGRRFDAMLETFRSVWTGESFGTAGAIGPRRAGRPTWSSAARPTSRSRARRSTVTAGSWAAAHRTTSARASRRRGPRGRRRAATASRTRCRSRTSRSATTRSAAADGYLRDYYGFLGDVAGMIAASAATDAATIRQHVDAFAAAGCDELVLIPCAADPAQVDLLADALE